MGAEAKAVRNSVGLSEISNFAKYLVTGSDAEAYLDRLLACDIPVVGRMTLAPMLKEDGRVIGDFSRALMKIPSSSLVQALQKTIICVGSKIKSAKMMMLMSKH